MPFNPQIIWYPWNYAQKLFSPIYTAKKQYELQSSSYVIQTKRIVEQLWAVEHVGSNAAWSDRLEYENGRHTVIATLLY